MNFKTKICPYIPMKFPVYEKKQTMAEAKQTQMIRVRRI